MDHEIWHFIMVKLRHLLHALSEESRYGNEAVIGFLHPDSAASIGDVNGAFSHSYGYLSFKWLNYTI